MIYHQLSFSPGAALAPINPSHLKIGTRLQAKEDDGSEPRDWRLSAFDARTNRKRPISGHDRPPARHKVYVPLYLSK